MFILKGKLLRQKTPQLGERAFGTSSSVRCSSSVINVFQTLWCKAFGLIEEAVIIHGFCSGLSLFSCIVKPSSKNLVGLQLYVCSGRIFLVFFLPFFMLSFRFWFALFFGQ